MGLLDRIKRAFGREERAFDPSNWAIPAPGAEGMSSFARPDLRQPESALQSIAIWSATNLIANLGSSLPIDTFRKTADGAVAIGAPKLIEDPGGEGHGLPDWLYQYFMSQLLSGNTYGQLGAADRNGYPAQIVLYQPDTVRGTRDQWTGKVTWQVMGRQMDTVWHRRAYPMAGRLLGMSPIEHHALSIGQNLSAARFGAQWFTDGAHPSSLLRNTEQTIDGDTAREVKARYLASVHGTREPVVMGKGWEHHAIQVTAEESQFLETQRYTAADCARIYGPGLPEILGYDSGGSMTYANVEQRSTDLLIYTLDPWLTRTEAMFTSMLPRGQFVKFNRGALLRTDLLTRYRAHAVGIAAHFLLPDEARGYEDLPPLTEAQAASLAVINITAPSISDGKGAP